MTDKELLAVRANLANTRTGIYLAAARGALANASAALRVDQAMAGVARLFLDDADRYLSSARSFVTAGSSTTVTPLLPEAELREAGVEIARIELELHRQRAGLANLSSRPSHE